MLEIKSLRKTYGKVNAILNVNLSISQKGVYAFVGPNGSGKTTLLTCLAGLREPTAGTISLDGMNPLHHETKKKIGFSTDDDFFFPQAASIKTLLKYEQNMKYGDASDEKEIDYLLDRYDLSLHADKTVAQCSFGMKKKLSICSALLGKPKFVVFDEPTNGIDTKAILMFKEDVHSLVESGSIVIVSSHVLDFLEAIVNETYFLKYGNIVKKTSDNNELENIYRELYL
jgi:ABC-type multidrug transport system ATPase subunit